MKTLFHTVDQLAGAMRFHRERHVVLAGNVANVDTPGYRPADLSRQGLPAGELAMARTNEQHLSSGEEGETKLTFDSSGQTQGADGNAVSLDRELAKMDANRTRYTTSTELLSRRAALLRYAASDGNA